jgi:dihydrofolate reductase
MKRIVWFMHVTLDGFVAGPAGEMNWINVDEELFDYAGRETASADTALYGRATYDMMQGYWPTAADGPNPSKHDIEHSRWYNSVTKVVVSKSLKGKELDNTKIISDNAAEEIRLLKEGEGANIVVFGSPSLGHLLTQHKLIDDYWLFVNPVVLGEGISLFAGSKLKLKLLSAERLSSGVVALHYERNDS